MSDEPGPRRRDTHTRVGVVPLGGNDHLVVSVVQTRWRGTAGRSDGARPVDTTAPAHVVVRREPRGVDEPGPLSARAALALAALLFEAAKIVERDA